MHSRNFSRPISMPRLDRCSPFQGRCSPRILSYHLFASPNTVKEIHKDYINAGSQIIKTNTFRTNKRTLEDTKLCINGSQICIGIIDENDNLFGFARILTDFIYKALIFDIIISNEKSIAVVSLLSPEDIRDQKINSLIN